MASRCEIHDSFLERALQCDGVRSSLRLAAELGRALKPVLIRRRCFGAGVRRSRVPAAEGVGATGGDCLDGAAGSQFYLTSHPACSIRRSPARCPRTGGVERPCRRERSRSSSRRKSRSPREWWIFLVRFGLSDELNDCQFTVPFCRVARFRENLPTDRGRWPATSQSKIGDCKSC